MISIKRTKIRLVKAIFGCFFGILGLILPIFANSLSVYAEETDDGADTVVSEQRNEQGELMEPVYIERPVQEESSEEENQGVIFNQMPEKSIKTCDDSLGSLGWLVCPTTGKISEAVDWLYEKNRDILEINPVRADDSSPVYMVWNYFLGVANIAFVIFLLIVIYSQITGVGISNYGLKKALPKLIIAAILVNLSFFICSLAVDLSNVFGNGLRGLFSTIAESSLPDVVTSFGVDSVEAKLALSDMYTTLAGGSSVGALALIALFEGGEIWLLIPAVLGALVAVVVGLITIALRQVVVVLLIMIAPLAIVAYILPNTESMFKKWKDLFIKMLVFYPMYSTLFGAANLAGWAIIASANDGFGVILGTAVQIFPLFFSWSLMKMSGTFLGTVNAKITGIFARPLATNRAWAESHRELTRQRLLASNDVYSPTLRLRQYINNRRVAREGEIKENSDFSTMRGRVYAVKQLTKKDGTPTREGRRAYDMQARKMKYQKVLNESQADFDEGLGQQGAAQRSHDFRMKSDFEKLDYDNMHNADLLAASEARLELVNYNNAKSRHERMNAAMDAHMDAINGYKKLVNENGELISEPRSNYRFHYAQNSNRYNEASSRYNAMSAIMEGNAQETQYVMANAAHSYDTHKKVYEGKMQKFFDYSVPTKDLEYRLDELSKNVTALDNIDAIIAGMRVLNQRGDTDLVKRQLDQLIEHGVDLGTRASQSIASFLMFDVKDNDPFLRRFGKYINLETARMFNENDRKLGNVTYDEYIKGYHIEPNGQRMYAKKDMVKLVEGTSLDNVERTAFGNLDESLMKAYGYTGNGGRWDVERYLRKKGSLMTAFEPAFLSAMQKWPSGSEQINSGIKMWLGYELKQKKDANGNVEFDEETDEALYELKPMWGDKRFRGFEDIVHKFYHDRAIDFVKDQTASQIQNMRTDVREPLIEHLIDEYLGKYATDQPEMYAARRAEYEAEVRRINNAQYEGATEKERNKARRKAMDKYRRQIAGIPYRKLLYETSKLEQLVKTNRSGGGNMMKDWNREMIGLDGSNLAQIDLNRYKAEAERNQNGTPNNEGNGAGADDPESQRIAAEMNEMDNEVRQLWDDNGFRDNDRDDGFYNAANAYLAERFGDGPNHPIKKKFRDYHNRQRNVIPTNLDMISELLEIIKDANNFR